MTSLHRLLLPGALLLCAAACTVDVSVPAGKACDADHPCSEGRVCSADGVCVDPGGGRDGGAGGGTDGGLNDDGGAPDSGTADAGTCENDPSVGTACDAGLGECVQTGQILCANGTLSCSVSGGTGSAELCDGKDNDCNGLVDDDLTPPPCLNKGVCASAAPPQCLGDAGFAACSYGPDYELVETKCDGLDNDCDGIVDEVSGCLYTLYGTASAAGFKDGAPDVARLSFPGQLAADSAGNLYVADTANHAIRKIDTQGNVTTLAGDGTCGNQIGAVAQAKLCEPTGVAVNGAGTTVYFSDSYVNRIRKIENGMVSDVAGTGVYGFTDGAASTAKFRTPMGLFLEANGDLLIADQDNQRIRRWVASSNTVTTVAGTGSAGTCSATTFATALFDHPTQVVEDSAGNIYVSEISGDRICKLSSDGVTVSILAGSPAGTDGYAEGVGTAVMFQDPGQMALDVPGGMIYITDTENNRVRAVPLNGTSTTVSIAGAGTNGSSLGTGANARFTDPIGLVRVNGALYVGDYTHAIKKLTLSNPTTVTAVTEVAGSSVANQSVDGPASTARLSFPWHFSVDPSNGAIYVVEDQANLVREIASDGTFSTIGGDKVNFGQAWVNGAIATSVFDDTRDVKLGPDGKLYVCEEDNDDVRVIDLAAQTVTPWAGQVNGSGNGITGGYLNGATPDTSRFNSPHAIAFWKDGSGQDVAFVADEANRAIRKIVFPAGAVTLYAGTAATYGSADGPVGTGHFRAIEDLVVDPATGILYVVDADSIRKVDTTGTVTTLKNGIADDLFGIDLDGNVLVAVGGHRVYTLDLNTNALTVVFNPAHQGVQDGTAATCGVGNFHDVIAYPDLYLLLDYWGRRVRQLWK